MSNTFSDFKTNFYKRIDDFSLFDCDDFNLLKVVLDGLLVKYSEKGKVRSYLFYPLPFFSLIVFFKYLRGFFKREKRYKLSEYEKFSKNKIIISDVGRLFYDEEKKPISMYFSNIIEEYSRSELCIIIDKVIDHKLDYDLDWKTLENSFLHTPLSQEEKKIRSQIKLTFNKIVKSKLFNKVELENIKFSFHSFFNQYKVWNRLLVHMKYSEKCFFVCHYHKEGQIMALKKNKIFCVELQHGLIAEQDIFYCFPKKIELVRKKALFADRIFTYGEYWNNVLLKGFEYDKSQIVTIGYYLYNDFSGFEKIKNEIIEVVKDKRVLLVTTQTSLHNYFIDYLSWLELDILKNNLNAIVFLKPHPAENIKVYEEAFKYSKTIKVVDYPTPILFGFCELHLSIYSTTLFDSLRFEKPNFSLYVDSCKDYVDAILDLGISRRIMLNQNPFIYDKDIELVKYFSPDYFFQTLAIKKIHEIDIVKK